MSFYITLPSNASLDKFPKNTQSSFTTELQNAIVLNQSYEVALTELNYHSKISIDLGQLIIDDFFSNYYDFQFPLLNKITIDLKIINGTETEDFIETLNRTIKLSLLKYDYKNRYMLAFFKTPEEVMRQVEKINKSKKQPYFDVFECVTETFEDVFKGEKKIKTSEYRIIDGKDSIFSKIYLEQGGFFDEEYQKWTFNNEQAFKKNDFEKKCNFFKINELHHIKLKQFQKDFQQMHEFNFKYFKTLEERTQYFSTFGEDPFNEEVINLYFLSDDQFMDIGKEFINKVQKESLVKANIRYNYPEILEFEYNTLTTLLHNQSFEDDFNRPHFKIKHASTDTVYVSGRFADLVLNRPKGFLNENIIYNIPEVFNIVQYGLVYLDIITEQTFGDKRAKIIKCFPIRLSEPNQVVSFFENLQYANVAYTRLTTIQLLIKDMEGNPIQFEDNFSTVIATLHFKPV